MVIVGLPLVVIGLGIDESAKIALISLACLVPLASCPVGRVARFAA